MDCPRCGSALPAVAQFCHGCGADLRHPDAARRKSFAVKPDEPVASLAIVSSIMPRGAAEHPRRYAWALVAAMGAALVAAVFGLLPIALFLAAFAIPLVYVIYLYDINLWEDEPIPVTLLAFVATFVLGLLFTWGWTSARGLGAEIGADGMPGGPSVRGLLLTVLLAPIAGEIIRELGPIVLARMPHFDDLMDGLTFGVISGVAYAAAETLIVHWPLLQLGWIGATNASLNLATLFFLEGFVKPLVYGTAAGIACAEFSGLGKGFDGFTPRYFTAFLQAVIAVALYNGGVFLLRFLDPAPLALFLQVLWGLAILAFLILRIRGVLHTGLMEAALEHAARTAGEDPGDALDFCSRCEMPLVPGTAFCSHCGTATRVHHLGRPRPPAMPAAFPAGATAAARAGTAVEEHGVTTTSEEGRA